MYGFRMPEPVEKQGELACEVCGRFGAYAFAGKNICADCYAAHCSCCPEFEKAGEEE